MHKGHRSRMRERFLKEGLESFQDHEKFEFILYNVISRKDTNGIGHDLIEHFGSFSSVIDAPIDALTKIDGIGENTAIFIKLIPQMCRYYLEDKQNYKNKVVNEGQIGTLFLSKFIGRTNETVMLMLLDAKYKFLFCGVISEGSVNSADIYIRRIVELSVRYNASKAILAHNHPSGVALPSKEDISSTHFVYNTLKLVGVELIDHVIVADDDYTSMAKSNLGQDVFDEEIVENTKKSKPKRKSKQSKNKVAEKKEN